MTDENYELSNSIEIFSTDDVKLKTLAEVISNKSSIEILNLLFHNEMTANEIAQRTNMSLQLAKYHLEKMQKIELVYISKVEKNCKARDMNYYKASKIAIVITPSTITEKAKQSKMLRRSFHSISKFFGVSILSALAAFSLITAESRFLSPLKSWYSDFSLPIKISGTGLENSIDESLYMAKTKVDLVVANPGAGSGTPVFDPYTSMLNFGGIDFTIILMAVAGIGAMVSFMVFNKIIHKYQKDNDAHLTDLFS